ncbi:MAG: biotin/lipoate A/B protein ligase family protein [Anaerolineae bacterium]|jgi:lipoate-protein ligase A
MNLNRLNTVPWQDSQLLYHAQPRLKREGLNLLSPATPYVCLGRFQDVAQEVDFEFCRQNDIPVFRREVGGGAVYLDGEQLFYQLVIHRDNPLVPAGKEAFYRKFLQAPIEAYRALGIQAEYKPVNDIVANGRKISGNGVGEIGEHIVFVGNLIVDFDYDMMARVLRVPDEKFRDKVYKTLHENLSTVKRELGSAPPRGELWDLLTDAFTKVLGPIETRTTVDSTWRAKTDELASRFLSDDWLFQKGGVRPDRAVKIRAGVEVRQKMHKAAGGLIRATTEVRDGVVANVSFSGDFFFYPEEKLLELETTLEGVPVEDVEQSIVRFYEEHDIESPEVAPADFARVLLP